MTTPTSYQCLERVAADVAALVPDPDSIVRVEVEFDPQPLEVRFVSTPYRPGQLYDPSLSTPLSVAPDLEARVRRSLEEYLGHSRSWRLELLCMTLSVAIDGSFSIGETCRERPGR